MGLIKQQKFMKQKDVEQTLLIPKNIIEELDKYIQVAGIDHGIVRNGEVKTTSEAKREYLILEMIKRILTEDREEMNQLSPVEEVVEHQVSEQVRNILGEEMSQIAQDLE